MTDYSQYGEGTFLEWYFTEVPPKYKLLVDVGAKGRALSNTYQLIEEEGWGGIMIEPLPGHFEDLVKDLGGSQWVHLVNAAVSAVTGKANFYLHELRGHSSLVRKSDNWIEVDLVTLPNVLKIYNYPHDFDLLSVDAEGHDNVIISHLLTESGYRPSVIVFEKSACVNLGLLEYSGYRKVHETEANSIYMKGKGND